jgi:hypothetical protein
MEAYVRCQCPDWEYLGHSANECPNDACVTVIRDGKVLQVCYECTFPYDVYLYRGNPALQLDRKAR